MGSSLTLHLSGHWWDDGLAIPQSSSPLPTVEEEPMGELTGRWDQKDSVPPPPNPPMGTLGDGGVSPTPLPPPHVVEAPKSC